MENRKCLIYSRVSSERQVNEGHGLDSQEKRCRDYAIGQGYKVVGIFRDEGKSGGLFERPAMKELLSELEKYIHEPTNTIVVFDDLKRFARDTQVHFQLKKEIYGRNGSVESPNFKFEDTPEGKFVETVLAAQAELERNQNRKQVIQKQKARLEQGYWAFGHPLALVTERDPIHGKLLVPNEPYTEIYKQAIELFADKSLLTIDDVKRFINNKFELKGFGKVSQLDNFLFTETGVGKDLYSLPKDLPDGYLYLATAKEITLDLVAEPERMPVDFAHTNLDLESDTPRSIFVL